MTYEEALAALADPRRRAIFEALRDGPKSVSDIARGQPVSRPAVSQHLKVLEAARLVAGSQAGQRRIYEVRPEGIEALRRYLDGLWDGALSAFAKEIDSKGGDPS